MPCQNFKPNHHKPISMIGLLVGSMVGSIVRSIIGQIIGSMVGSTVGSYAGWVKQTKISHIHYKIV
jgi:outer membrane lipoprotein SlyB